MIDIMFVCTGNICRSAMADYILKNKVQKDSNLREKIRVCSSGVSAYNGDISTEEAISVMKDEYDIDLTSHRATNVSDSNILQMDLILAMTLRHKFFLVSMYPNLSDKIYTLREYVGETANNANIDDPYGYGKNVYSDCAKQINDCIDKLLVKLEKEGKI